MTLRVPRDQSLGSLGITASKIDAAHRSISRVGTERSAGVIEFRIENVFAVTPGSYTIINNQREHDSARGFLSVGNIFAPTRAPGSVSADPVPGSAPIWPVVPKLTLDLFGTVIGGCPGHTGRRCQ